MSDIILEGQLYQKVEGNKLTLVIDLKQRHGDSSSGNLHWDLIVKRGERLGYYRKVGPAPDAQRETVAQQHQFNAESNQLLRETLAMVNENPRVSFRTTNPHVRSDSYKLAAQIEKHLGITFGKAKL